MLVTDGDNRATLAVTRALGRDGHEVLVGEKRPHALAHASRYCLEPVVYPDPVRESAAFLDRVAGIVRDRAIDVLVPVADITTSIVAHGRDRIGCAVPIADVRAIERAADKVDTIRTAEALGLPVPRSVVVASPSEIPEWTLGYPLVVKPWRSRVLTPAGWMSSSVGYAASRDELVKSLRARAAHEFPVLLQERVVGSGIGVFACCHEGRPVALFAHRRLRERPPWGGASVLCQSIEVPEVAGDCATRLLEEIGWQGAAMVEFKEDERDGLPKLMEINGRFWGSLQLAIDAGVNFPALLLQTVAGPPFGPQPPYRVGVQTRWFWGDVDSLLVTLRGGKDAPPVPRSRGRAVAEFARFAGANLHYDNPKWDDMRPFAAETRQWFRTLAEGMRA